MKNEEVINLYKKEREYQKKIFGEYSEVPVLNVGSFILFLDDYINKAKKYYIGQWTDELPPWLEATKESLIQKTCPVDTYKELIKIMALAGAALETYTKIDVSKWREEGINEKWTTK